MRLRQATAQELAPLPYFLILFSSEPQPPRLLCGEDSGSREGIAIASESSRGSGGGREPDDLSLTLPDRLERSRLGLLDGVGALRLMHDEQGALVDGVGIWKPRGEGLGYHDLLELLRPGVALLYAGPAWEDSTEGAPDQVTVEVEVDAVERERQPDPHLAGESGVPGDHWPHQRSIRERSRVEPDRSGPAVRGKEGTYDGIGEGGPLVRFRLSSGERDGPGR